MKKSKKMSRGITLIALVVTIIVLLILAGISVSTITGNDGIINRAGEAKLQSEIIKEKEIVKQSSMQAMGQNKYGNLTKLELQSKLDNYTKNGESIDVIENGDSLIVYFSASKRFYLVDQDGETKNIKEKPIENTLVINGNESIKSPYVKYIDKNGNIIICRVLWDVNSIYGSSGIQIISENPVTTIKLGKDSTLEGAEGEIGSFERARWCYNNAIKILNDKAKDDYINTKLSPVNGARSVGSLPNSPYSESGDFNGFYSSVARELANGLRDLDTNYEMDFNQLGILGIRRISDTSIAEEYWLASRETKNTNGVSSFKIRNIEKNGVLHNYAGGYMCYANSAGYVDAWDYSYEYGLRPVFTLKSGLKIIAGDGKTAETAYLLLENL